MLATRGPGRLLLAASLLLVACGGGDEASAPGDPRGSAAAEVVPASTASEERSPERPLPAFGGWGLDGERIHVSSFLGRRLLIFFFNPEFAGSAPVADAVRQIGELRGEHNFAIVGVGVGSQRGRLEEFVADRGLDFPVIDDSSAQITRKLRLQSPLTILVADARGFVTFGMGEFPPGEEGRRQVDTLLRTALRLPASAVETQPLLGTHPPAPDFEARVLGGEEPFRLSDQRGRAVVLIFFLHTCPHCHHALASLRGMIDALPQERRPVLVGLEITGRTAAVRRELKDRDLDFFPVVFDDDGSIQEAYGVFAGVPDTVLIDREGRIRARIKGWKEDSDPPLLRMRVARLVGAPVPMLLRAKGYTGSEACGVCHQLEYETWSLTTHATAFDTLVKHGSEDDAECVSCHVVGHGETGGFTNSVATPYLENVGCEECHGRGGPHLSSQTASNGYESTCKTCHDPKHSLGFEYASFLPIVSHAANAHLAKLPLEEKRKLLAERGQFRDDLLPTNAPYVGSETCQGCHAAEYATWSEGAHAGAMATLAAKGEARNADCQVCHTTGFGKSGGFAKGADPAAHADLARVGCESCHGPGGNHVAEDAAKVGTIVSLTDKCDSCVILQICGSCHDDANDPGFEFEVQEKIEAQRHGTITPSASRSEAGS